MRWLKVKFGERSKKFLKLFERFAKAFAISNKFMNFNKIWEKNRCDIQLLLPPKDIGCSILRKITGKMRRHTSNTGYL